MSGINKSQRAVIDHELVSTGEAPTEAPLSAVTGAPNSVGLYDETAQAWQQGQSVDAAAREAEAEEHAQREAAQNALRGVKSAVDAFASKPKSRFNVTDAQVGLDAGASERLKEGAAKLPREAIVKEVERQISANPAVSEAEVGALTARVMKHLDAAVAVGLTQKMKQEVTGLMSKAMQGFEAAANDPKMLEHIAEALAEKEGGEASATDKQEAARYRELAGLSKTASLTPANLKAALKESAAMLEREKTRFEGHEENTIYRALLTQDVRGLLIAKGEAGEGSWAAQSLEQIHERGEHDEKDLAIAKGACAIALAVTTGGLGAPIAAAAAAAFNAPGVGSAFHKIDEGRAGALSGSAARDADLTARHEATHTLVEAAASVAASAAMPAVLHKTGHAAGAVKQMLFAAEKTERVANGVLPFIGHKAGDAAAEAVIGVTAYKTKPNPGRATGKNLLE